MTITTITVRKNGRFTLPIKFRTKYGVDEGDVFTLIDMGMGLSFSLRVYRGLTGWAIGLRKF
jgi:bifunctional DNA-binding transcriptional regulator/antitoxin component of YhaV-PrlF toxin-antitoxin module